MTNRPVAQLDIEADLHRLNDRAEMVTHEVGQRARAAASADAAYSRAFYAEFLAAEGSMDMRKAAAKAATADLYDAKVFTAALLLSAQEAGRNCRAQLESLRSVNANHRPLVAS